jgi:hypothetical protein
MTPPKLDVPYQQPQGTTRPWPAPPDPYRIGPDSDGGSVRKPGRARNRY